MKKRVSGGLLLLLFIAFAFIVCYGHDAKNQTQAEQEPTEAQQEQVEPQCGNPIQDSVRINCGIMTGCEDNLVSLVDEDGNKWEVEVGDPTQFDSNYYYCIFFDTKGTNDITDDEITKLWREVW